MRLAVNFSELNFITDDRPVYHKSEESIF